MRAWHWYAVGLIVTAAPTGVWAQDSSAKQMPPSARICDMSMRIVSVRLIDAKGAPVNGAAIAVRRVRTRSAIANAEPMGEQGDYRVIEDGVLRDLRPGGEPFDVTFTKNGRRKRVRLIIGMDAGRCHVMQKGGPTSIVL